MSKPYLPMVIIGAPRSGTNMLRDVLCRLPGVGTWPCDEINYIWRHGNVRYPSDVFTAEMARPEIGHYIRNSFSKLADTYQLDHVVEKTCANSLRVPFVDQVIPDARYVYIVRNGLDVVASAKKRWQAELDLAYVMRKARYVPLTDLPYYAFRYMANHLYRLFSKENRLAYWGPTLDNMPALLEQYGLDEICALQWKACVDLADAAFASMPSKRVFSIRYEEFVADPVNALTSLATFSEIECTSEDIQAAVSDVKVTSVGKGHKELDTSLTQRILPLIQDTLVRHDYS